MIDDKKETIHSRWNLKAFGVYLCNGFRSLVCSGLKRIAAVIFIICSTLLLYFILTNKPVYPRIFNPNGSIETIRISFIIIIYALALLLFFFLLGAPLGAKRMNDNLKRAGLVNHTGEAPLLLSKKSLPNNNRVKVYEFYSMGISRDIWEDRLNVIESALNLKIGHFDEGRNSRIIRMYAVDGNYTLPKTIIWNDNYLVRNESGFMLALGEDVTGEKITINLKHTPHVLIGGSTGSGKSVLLKLLLMESVKKGAEVIISDFKGGVDFPKIWQKKCTIITEKQALTSMLKDIVFELEKRKNALKVSGCANIDEYNKLAESKMKRIVFACDEVAEILDKTGLSKEDKAEVAVIENYLSTVARQGRAFGIHLFLATQRPDSNILAGQIKNNLDYRVCGRADLILSQIILDNGDANERIAKNAQGRFLDNNGTLFQAYWFDENNW